MNDLYIPRFGDETVKDKIIESLVGNSPLSLKELSYKITKSNSVTYQAIYKSVRELIDKDILDKNENKYEINKKWAIKLKIIVDKIESHNMSTLTYLEESESLTLLFDSFMNFGKFFLNISDLLKDNIQSDLLINQKHIFNFLWMTKDDHLKFNSLKDKIDIYIACDSDDEVERWFGKFWERFGAKICYGTKYCSTSDFLVFGDYIFQIFFDSELKEWLKNSSSNLNEFDVSKELELLLKNPVKIIIFKDKNLSEEIRERTLKNFIR